MSDMVFFVIFFGFIYIGNKIQNITEEVEILKDDIRELQSRTD